MMRLIRNLQTFFSIAKGNRSEQSLILIFLLLLIVSCGKDPNPENPATGNCPNFSIPNESVMPFDTVFVGLQEGIDVSGTEVEFWQNDTRTPISIPLQLTPGGKAFFIAPLNPSDPLSAGSVQVRPMGEANESSCQAVTLQLKELPAAPGYMAQVSVVLEKLLDQRITYLGYSLQDIEGDISLVPDDLMPFVLPYYMLTTTEGEFSVQKELKSDQSYFPGQLSKGDQVELAGRILKNMRFRELLEEDLRSFGDHQARLSAPAARVTTSCNGLNGKEIGRQMRLAEQAAQYLDPSSEKGQNLASIADATLYSGLIPGLGTAAAMMGGAIFVYRKMYEGVYNSYFNRFTHFEFSMRETTVYEEVACYPLDYFDAKVSVSSTGWSVDSSLWESLFQMVGFFTTRIGWKGKFDSIPLDITVIFAGKSLDAIASKGYLDKGKYKIDARSCQNIDVTDPEFIYGKISGDAFSVNQQKMQAVPEKAGTASLEVGMRTLYFGGQTINSSKELNIPALHMVWNPSTVTLEPGKTALVKLNLYNAFNKTTLKTQSAKGAETQVSFEDPGVSFTGAWNYRIHTPLNEKDFPYVVVAEHTSRECLRGKPDAQPALAYLNVRTGLSVEIYSLDFGCLATGSTRNYSALVHGGKANEVNWSAFDEALNPVSISPDGVFKAPGLPGDYSIIATSKADASASDTLLVSVTNSCACHWTLSTNALNTKGSVAHFSRQPSTGFYFLQLGTEEGGQGITLLIPSHHIPVLGAQTEFTLKQGETWSFTGLWKVQTLVGPSPEDADGNPDPAPSSLHIRLRRNEDNSLKGEISGTLVSMSATPPFPISMTPVRISFQAAEFNLAQGLDGCN